MRQPCPTDQHYPNDPQDEGLPPLLYTCEHCGSIEVIDNICEVPSGKLNVIYCCPDCFDEVCDEEGINTQTMELLT